MQDFVGENIFFQEKNDCKISDNEIYYSMKVY